MKIANNLRYSYYFIAFLKPSHDSKCFAYGYIRKVKVVCLCLNNDGRGVQSRLVLLFSMLRKSLLPPGNRLPVGECRRRRWRKCVLPTGGEGRVVIICVNERIFRQPWPPSLWTHSDNWRTGSTFVRCRDSENGKRMYGKTEKTAIRPTIRVLWPD